jgi:adenine/guanine phosphoribosyltransferase-like PRPP-binding protein
LLLPGRKGPNPPPGAWEDQFIIKEEVRSYTTGKMSSFAFNGLEEFDNILLIDDVIAQGYTGELIINKFREKNINVLGLGVYFDKIFQDGVYRIEKNTGVASFSVLRIEEIFDDGRINRQKARYYREDDIIPTP